ncbi:MAG TPA: Uma2 family endonuclease [Anaerolineae bacterium]|nr:Uma2 family endonuclease [Anaerolineae bacterium]
MTVPVLQRDEQQMTQIAPASLARGATGTNGGGRLPLHSGDRLTRLEFERRYEAYPDLKAELIEGVVVVSSPVHVRVHGLPHSAIMAWLGAYWAATPGVIVNDNTTLRLDLENVLQPDACLWVENSGRAWIDKDDYLAGAPELVVEIAASSAANDLHDKLRVYRRNGVQEYLVLVTYEQEVHWFNWQSGVDHVITPDADGILRSLLFPGLWLDPTRFWQGDVAGLLAVVQQGLASLDHAAFVE